MQSGEEAAMNMRTKRAESWTFALAVLAACANGSPQRTAARTMATQTTPPAALPDATNSRPEGVIARTARPGAPHLVADQFEAYRAQFAQLGEEELIERLSPATGCDAKLAFDPAQARYYDKVVKALKLTGPERDLLRRQGLVSIDHAQRYSMGSAYNAIYTRDLPVFITSDSILSALHSSYDAILASLERGLFVSTITDALESARGQVARETQLAKTDSLRASLSDVDLYLTVAENLLRGGGAPKDAAGATSAASSPTGRQETWDGKLLVNSTLGQNARVLALLEKVASLELEDPGMNQYTEIYGGNRSVDFSQFRPRGHYSQDVTLSRYFRALMWLGRPDLGFCIATQPGEGCAPRERRSAFVLVQLLRSAGKLGRLASMADIIGFMVGRSDDVGPAEVAVALERAGVRVASDLADDATVGRVTAALEQLGPQKQQIRAQPLVGSVSAERAEIAPPFVFQLFGQRFVLDSFVLSKVVFDSIVYRNERPQRQLPTGLDVMAALGDADATALLAPDLARFHYGANLLAARRVVEQRTPETWKQNLYEIWLGALRTLHEPPPKDGGHVPNVMRNRPWRIKELTTQLASWAELRHDTLLYAKQSYTVSIACEYPEGYVEPYPEFFASLGVFAREGERLLGRADVSHPDPGQARQMLQTRDWQVAFLHHFAETMDKLELLARKELAAQPFTAAERLFLKKTIDIRGGGSGPPRYDGWYPGLLFAKSPTEWAPTVADVHTSVLSREALEAATGDVRFLIVAVDNQNDRAVYVGPSYSYYEFAVPVSDRMTDEQWQARLSNGKAPPRPQWTDAFQMAATPRDL
jgi:hypothetical protein